MSIYLILILMISSTLQKKITQIHEENANPNPSDSVDNSSNNQVHNDSSIKLNAQNVQIDETVQTGENSKAQTVQEADLYFKQTNWNDFGTSGPINFLDRHFVNCDQSNSALNSFKMEQRKREKKGGLFNMFEKDSWEVRYTYGCVKSLQISNNCKTIETPVQDANFIVEKSLDALSRHFVTCPDNKVMKDFNLRTVGRFDTGFDVIFRLGRDSRPRLFYKYTCCDANISREIYAQTQKTYGGDNEYYNLQNQFINGKDFNAISSFNMQSPPGEIFFFMKLSTLKGEKSPSFPDPCDVQDSPAPANSNSKSFLELNSGAAKNKNKSGCLTDSKVFLGKFYYNN